MKKSHLIRNLLVIVDDESSMIHIRVVSQFHQC